MKEIICPSCSEKTVHKAKGLCNKCYKKLFRKAEKKLPRGYIPEGGDPLIRWIFLEMKEQRVTNTELSRKSGFSVNSVSILRRNGNARFLTVKTLIEALGYDLIPVAKEPADAPKSLVD